MKFCFFRVAAKPCSLRPGQVAGKGPDGADIDIRLDHRLALREHRLEIDAATARAIIEVDADRRPRRKNQRTQGNRICAAKVTAAKPGIRISSLTG